jgi:hypothetical protein
MTVAACAPPLGPLLRPRAEACSIIVLYHNQHSGCGDCNRRTIYTFIIIYSNIYSTYNRYPGHPFRVKYSCDTRIRVEQHLFVVSFKSLHIHSANCLPCLCRWHALLMASYRLRCARC